MTSVAEERHRLAALGGKLILRSEWGSTFNYGTARNVVEPARQQFVHISVTNPAAYNSYAAHVRGIEGIGRRRFPNTGGSYNRVVVFGVSTAYELQPIGRRGAHTVNDFGYSTCRRYGSQCPGQGGSFSTGGHGNNLNFSARAYVYGAMCEASAPDSVIHTLARTMANDRLAGFVAMDAEIHGHRCVSAKSCPCQAIWSQMHKIETLVQYYMKGGGSEMQLDDKISPTPTARKRFPEGYSLKVGKVLAHILGLAYQATMGKIAPNGWMKARWPDMPKEGYSPRTYWRSGYGHSRAGKEEAAAARSEAAAARSAAVANGKQLGSLAGEVAGLRSAVEQLALGGGQPIDMVAVQSASRAGAQEAMAELSITVTVEPAEPDLVEPAEEPDGSEPDPDGNEDDTDGTGE